MAVRSGPFLGALVRAATHEAPPCLCTPTRPPLLSLLRTIPLHVVRPRIQNFSSCEGTTSGATFLSSVCLFPSSRLSSPRFFLVSFFTWDSPSSGHLPCCFQTHIGRRLIFLMCAPRIFWSVSPNVFHPVGLSRPKFVWQQFERHVSNTPQNLCVFAAPDASTRQHSCSLRSVWRRSPAV